MNIVTLREPRLALVGLVLSSIAFVACVDEEDTPAETGSTTAGSSGSGTAGSSSAGKGGSAAGAGGTSAGAAGSTAGKAGAGGTSAGAAGSTAGKAGAGGTSAGAAGSTAGKGGSAGSSAGAAGSSAGAAGSSAGAAGSSAGGAGAAGSAGSGGSSACLDASSFATVVDVPSALPWCVTGVFTTDTNLGGATFGSHGGPMISAGSGKTVTVTRFSVPAGSTGAATKASTTLSPDNIPDGMLFWGGAFDAFGMTFLSYTGMGTGFPGEVIAMNAGAVDSRANANGFFSGVALASGAQQRLVYTGLSGLFSAPTTDNKGALYGYDLCSGKLTGAGCGAAVDFGAWEASSGPVVGDFGKAVFADMSTFMGDHEVRGFGQAAVLGAGPATGASMTKNKHFTSSLAAAAPAAGAMGWLFVSQTDETTFGGLPVELFAYDVDGTGTVTLIVPGVAIPPITSKTTSAQIAVFGAPDGTVWLGVDDGTGGHLVRLARK